MQDDPFDTVEPVAIDSPCVLVCAFDTSTGWCLGCGRTRDEVARWTALHPAERRDVLGALPARMAALPA